MTVNTVQNIDFLKNDLPDKCANLIIADPPYYKVKGDFDFIWKTFDDYLKDVEKWCLECKRILKDNGTILWYGDAKNISYAQIIFDKHFNLLNSIVWENTNDHKQQIRFNEDLRTFAPLTERILMYGLESEDLTGKHYEPIKFYFWDEYEKSGLTLKTANELMKLATTGANLAGELFGKKRDRFVFPTKEKYKLLQKSGYFKREYEELRKEYEELRRPFNNALHLGDVIRLPNYETSDYDHDTIKPEKLTRILIRTCSRKGDTLVVPFAGSGTECAMGVKESLKVYGYEITEKHANMSNERMKPHLTQTSLF